MPLVSPAEFRLHFFPESAWTDGAPHKEAIERFFEPSELARCFTPAPKGSIVHLHFVDAERAPEQALRELLTSAAISTLSPDGGGRHHGMFLFLTSRAFARWDSFTPPKPASGDGTANSAEAERANTRKENEFVIRVLLSHQIGRTVYTGISRRGDRLRGELGRFVKRCPGFRDIREALGDLTRDIETLRAIAEEELTPKALTSLAGRFSAPDLLENGGSGQAAAAESREVQYVRGIRGVISTPSGFVDALRRMYQLGRRPHLEAEGSVTDLTAFGGRGSFLYRRDLDLLSQALGAPEPALLEFLGTLQAGLRTYEILRDLAEWLAFGGSYWARQMRALDSGKPIPVLLVDEVLVADPGKDPIAPKLREDLIRRLNTIRRALAVDTIQEGVQFDYVDSDRVWEHVLDHVQRKKPLKVRPLPEAFDAPPPQGDPEATNFFNYRVILVEVEFREFYTGPAIVQKICTHLERAARENPGRPTPAVMVLSQSANFSHVQQSLNLGAQAFVRKERIYELPMRATRARITHQMAEPAGQKSNFRSLYSLLHEEIASLQSFAADDLILGESDDLQERNWLQALPKADLHTHIGTFVGLDTISALAFNTVGRFLERRQNSAELLDDACRLIDEVCAIVALTAFFASAAGRQGANKGTLVDRLAAAAKELLGDEGTETVAGTDAPKAADAKKNPNPPATRPRSRRPATPSKSWSSACTASIARSTNTRSPRCWSPCSRSHTRPRTQRSCAPMETSPRRLSRAGATSPSSSPGFPTRRTTRSPPTAPSRRSGWTTG